MGTMRMVLLGMELWGIILCSIAAICVHVARSFDPKGANRMIGLLVTEIIQNLFETVILALDGNTSVWGMHLNRIATLMAYMFGVAQIIESAAFIRHVITVFGGKRPKISYILVSIVCGVDIVLIVYSMFRDFYFVIDETNTFGRGPYAYVYYALFLVCMLLMLADVIIARRHLKGHPLIGLLAIIIVPSVGATLEVLGKGYFYVDISTMISYILVVALFESDYAHLLVEKEKMIQNEQIRLFNHQIQPHFIFNTLTAIRSLCEEDSKAMHGIDSLSAYLRGCVDMLTKTECVSVKKEMTVVDSFLMIIEMRFRDKIKTIRNIEDIDFTVPPFSIQSLVENSFYHGIRNREDHFGTLWISIYSENENNIVEIKDDGTGFDVDSVLNASEQDSHIGLVNIIRRVEAMSGGKVEISSVINEGTIVRMIFPMKRAQ